MRLNGIRLGHANWRDLSEESPLRNLEPSLSCDHWCGSSSGEIALAALGCLVLRPLRGGIQDYLPIRSHAHVADHARIREAVCAGLERASDSRQRLVSGDSRHGSATDAL